KEDSIRSEVSAPSFSQGKVRETAERATRRVTGASSSSHRALQYLVSRQTRHQRRKPGGAATPGPQPGTRFSGRLAAVLRPYFRGVFSLDLRSLAIFRIGVALILLFDLYYRSLDLRAFYTDWGLYPRSLMPAYRPAMLYALSGSAWWPALLMVVAGILAITLLV